MGVRGVAHLDSEPFFIFQRAEYRVRLQNYRGAESDAELSGDEADGRQAVEEQTDGCSEEDALAEEEPEEEILTPNYWPHEQHTSHVRPHKEVDCQHRPLSL